MSLFFGQRRPETREITSLPGAYDVNTGAKSLGWDRALGVIPVYASVRLIAEAISSLPLQQFRKVGDERTPMPLSKVFQPPRGSTMAWVQAPLVSLLMRGNAYGLRSGVDPDLGGITAHTEWLHPDKVRLDNNTWYYQGRKIEDPSTLLHIPGLAIPGSRLGVSPLTMCREAISSSADSEEFVRTWLANRARPSLVFKNTMQTLVPSEAAVVKERMKGTVKAGEPFVVGKDWDVSMLTLSAEDAGFLQSSRLSATQIATVFGIPPQMIGGDAGNSLTYSTVELNQLQFLANTLRPWITRLEDAFSSLLPKPHYVRFNVDALLRVDTKTRHEVYQIDRQIGLKNIDELRALEDATPLPDGKGTDYTPLSQMGSQQLARRDT